MMCSGSNHSRPLYNPKSSPSLLSPLVRIFCFRGSDFLCQPRKHKSHSIEKTYSACVSRTRCTIGTSTPGNYVRSIQRLFIETRKLHAYPIDSDIPDLVRRGPRIRQEQQVAAIERGFHRAAEIRVNLRVSPHKGTTHLRTTTMGLSLLVIMPSPFQIMSPVAITVAKLRSWSSAWAFRFIGPI